MGDYVTVLHARAHERRGTPAAKSTVRGYLMVIRSFCSFLCEPRYFDNRVDGLYAANKKAWLTTLRDACIAKVAYAYGVRRQELLRLQVQDFGPNPHVPQYGAFGAMYVR